MVKTILRVYYTSSSWFGVHMREWQTSAEHWILVLNIEYWVLKSFNISATLKFNVQPRNLATQNTCNILSTLHMFCHTSFLLLYASLNSHRFKLSLLEIPCVLATSFLALAISSFVFIFTKFYLLTSTSVFNIQHSNVQLQLSSFNFGLLILAFIFIFTKFHLSSSTSMFNVQCFNFDCLLSTLTYLSWLVSQSTMPNFL